MAIFGTPAAHEDDAERAILAGRRVADGVRTYGLQLAAERGLARSSSGSELGRVGSSRRAGHREESPGRRVESRRRGRPPRAGSSRASRYRPRWGQSSASTPCIPKGSSPAPSSVHWIRYARVHLPSAHGDDHHRSALDPDRVPADLAGYRPRHRERTRAARWPRTAPAPNQKHFNAGARTQRSAVRASAPTRRVSLRTQEAWA
jgi:hypothetical protein